MGRLANSIRYRLGRLLGGTCRRMGFDMVPYRPEEIGRDPFRDMGYFLRDEPCPVIFDVGANIGQTVDKFKAIFPRSKIHSFEPSPTTYAKLKAHCVDLLGVETWNYAVGSRRAILPFRENTSPLMSSFLPLGRTSWGNVEKTTEVEVLTLDSFASEHELEFIHILKSDTQGFDLEVLRGAGGLMEERKIGMVYFEFTFSEMYEGLPSFDEVFRLLAGHNFSPVAFYQPFYQEDLLSWMDVMFISKDFHLQRRDRARPAKA